MTIETLRDTINIIDSELLRLLNARYKYCIEIGKLKKEQNSAVLDSNREEQIIQRLSADEQHKGLVKTLWPAIMDFSKELQKQI